MSRQNKLSYYPSGYLSLDEIKVDRREKKLLRDLAKQLHEIAVTPEMEKRKCYWKQHNSLKNSYPMMLVFPECGWEELITKKDLKCNSSFAQGLEREILKKLYTYWHFKDDTVVENKWIVSKRVFSSGWGLEPVHIPSPEKKGSWHTVPVVNEYSDLKKIRFPEIIYDEVNTLKDYAFMQDLFGDIFDIKLEGVKQISYHLMAQYCDLRGFENVMMDFCEEPEMLHEALNILTEGHEHILNQYEKFNLLSVNNDNTYHNSGGNSFTDELPLPDYNPDKIRLCDMWGSAEAQELASVSPRMHAKFVLPYEKRLLKNFGLTGYGCCEDLTCKLDDVFTIPNIRRISISPWSDIEKCAEKLQNKYIYSWKPNPAMLVGNFSPEEIRKYVRRALQAAKANNSIFEMILKDTHTCENNPERFDIWTQIAREEIEKW